MPQERREMTDCDARVFRLCCGVALGAPTAYTTAVLIVFWIRAQHAAPALCQQGRTLHDSESRVAIDVPPAGVIDIECLVPVAVYDLRQKSEPRDNLRQLGLQGAGAIPLEHYSSGVKCIHHNASIIAHIRNVVSGEHYKNCEEDKWDCKHGECTAYEKALRVCLSKLEPQAYECTYVPGKPKLGVTQTSTQTQQIILSSLGLAFCLVLIFFLLMFDALDEPGRHWSKWMERAGWATAMIVFMWLWASRCFKFLTNKPLRYNNVAELNAPCVGDKLHMCDTPAPEEAPWNRTIGPVTYFIVHVLPLCCVMACALCSCMCLFIPWLQERRREAEAERMRRDWEANREANIAAARLLPIPPHLRAAGTPGALHSSPPPDENTPLRRWRWPL